MYNNKLQHNPVYDTIESSMWGVRDVRFCHDINYWRFSLFEKKLQKKFSDAKKKVAKN